VSDQIRTFAENLLNSTREMFPPSVQIVPASKGDFRYLDLAAYNSFSDWVKGGGFQFVSDVRIPQLTKSVVLRLREPVIRQHLSEGGAIVAHYYQLKRKRSVITVLTMNRSLA
jgi:hypothetical protein